MNQVKTTAKKYLINKNVVEFPNTDNERLATRTLKVQVQNVDTVRSVVVNPHGLTTDGNKVNAHVIVGVDFTCIFPDNLEYWIRVNNLTGEVEKIQRRYY